MSNNNSIINFGDISKPAVILIEKISDLVGGYFKPYQIRRIASAEADADKIKALNKIEITELQQRALRRFVFEEAKKQDNIEAITAKALPYLKEDANPKDVEDDWLTNFFDKCRLISDEQMQALWAKLLAGEANSPGNYSKRTIDLLSSLDKAEALLFKSLCRFGWDMGIDTDKIVPLIYDVKASIYTDHGITANGLMHLDDIGLIRLKKSIGGYVASVTGKTVCVYYYDTPVNIEFPSEQDAHLLTGLTLLANSGQELARICGSEPIPNFIDYVLHKWRDQGLIVSSPYPRVLLADLDR